MPNRYVREEAIESEPVNALCWQAEVFWRRLINRVDDFGRYTAHPALLRSSLFPMQIAKVSEPDITRLLAECEEKGLVFTYTSGCKRYLVMNKWEQGRAKESKYPPPPPDICERMQTYVYTLQHTQTDVPDPDSDSDPDIEGNQSITRARGVKSSSFPDLIEVITEASLRGIPPDVAEAFWNHFEAQGWVDRNNNPVRQWRPKLQIWWVNEQKERAKARLNGKSPAGERREIQETVVLKTL